MRLQLTKRTDYAIRACLYLASNRCERPASSALIARQMEIPERFLPRVLGDLTKAGIVDVQIGRSGGYRLLRAADRISILELVETVEGTTRTDRCVLRQRGCDATRPCAFHHVMNQAQSALIDVLASATLADIVAADRSGQVAPSANPTRSERTVS